MIINKRIIIGIFCLLILSSLVVASIKSDEEAIDFINKVEGKNNVYLFKVDTVSSKFNSDEVTVRWVVEIHAPTIQIIRTDEFGEKYNIYKQGAEITSISGITTVSNQDSLVVQKKKIEVEAIKQAKEWQPNPTIHYDNHELKYSKELQI